MYLYFIYQEEVMNMKLIGQRDEEGTIYIMSKEEVGVLDVEIEDDDIEIILY